MKYVLSFDHPQEKLVQVKIEQESPPGRVRLCLSKWRPGRYELQHYERNVANVTATDADGQVLKVEKVTTHIWEIEITQQARWTFSYSYYANQPDAGGSYVDQDQIYINPINLCMYRQEKLDEPCELLLELPEGYEVGGGLPEGPFTDFHQLADTPFFASKQLLHHRFHVNGIPTHLWFMGTCAPDFEKIEADFVRYSEAQMALFGEFPTPEYHYLFLMLPTRYRHGVEHYNSTVIAMGPGYRMMQPDFYKTFLEIASHELFHTWNIKALRPVDLLPYDYGQENYSRLHYITEGVTTYYGDLMIWKGGIWSLDEWIKSINGELKVHYRMGGKDYISLEEASFQSWVNGYNVDGIPNRRISFYTKGYLVAMLTDMKIRKATHNRASLDQVLSRMYHTFAKKGKGYTGEVYQAIIEDISGESFGDFFEAYVSGNEPLEPALKTLGDYYGLELVMVEPVNMCESRWGMKTDYLEGGSARIANLMPLSPGLEAGLSKGDEIISINNIRVKKNLDELLQFFSEEETVELHYFHQQKLQIARLATKTAFQQLTPQFLRSVDISPEQKNNLDAWQTVGVNSVSKAS